MIENVVVKELLDNLFSLRPLHDKLIIGQHSLPLSTLITHRNTKTEQYTRQFCFFQYEKVDWLVGCEATSKL
jgi:hypothetical protein